MINAKSLLPHAQPRGCAAGWLAADHVGEEAWWRELAHCGTPLIETADDDALLISFFWRDPAGDETRSPVRQVYISINCVTDHHHPQPQSLHRLPGTDVWHWSVTVDARWRGSYCLIPAGSAQLPPAFSGDAAARAHQQREWWISLFPFAIADPLNPRAPHYSSQRHPLSAAHMPRAQEQSAWHQLDAGQPALADPQRLHSFSWESKLLGNRRRIWIYTTGTTPTPETRPLAILLDGQNWVEGQPAFAALDCATESGQLPPAVWLFVDAITMRHREQELPCNAAFWQALQQELLPLVRQKVAFSGQADHTVVAGQSYGGLAALYAGLHWPQRFGRVLSQSGSFWWPEVRLIKEFNGDLNGQTGWLTAQVQSGALPPSRLKIFMEAGDREGDMAALSQQMHEALQPGGHAIYFRIYAGGHDGLCWRGGLIDGMRWLLADLTIATDEHATDA
ncbi:enterochelin esterase [Erwinia sp. Leaf53]|uniref:enterochelin esterase n=1 Tax=Erwinia sp. Leaf53 TaxID=1736225 RepID=UPI000B2F05DD|nr:enterochelin esterase [Erwinia sp. Leaf53]